MHNKRSSTATTDTLGGTSTTSTPVMPQRYVGQMDPTVIMSGVLQAEQAKRKAKPEFNDIWKSFVSGASGRMQPRTLVGGA